MDADGRSGSGTRASASLRFIDQFLQNNLSGRLTGLLLGQLDAFNRISTTFGHDESSAFCARYVRQLRDYLPEGTPVVRLSERRFAVLLSLDAISSIVEVAAGLAERRQPKMHVGEDTFLVDLTLGIAVYPTHADDAASLYRRAELALKDAREHELSYDLYQPESTQQHAALWKLESDLERAVRAGDLEVFHQPRLSVADARIDGVEALVRWRRPSGHFVPPEQFIPIAERAGSIVPVTWFVFDRVAEQAETWASLPKPFSVAINLAPSVLPHPELDARLVRLRDTLAQNQIGLTLEITEDSLVQNDDATPSALNRLRDHGVGLAIDDFGKGYSSLTYLKQIPATEIKIDRHFIATIAWDATDRQIVRSVIDLAHALGMSVTAEGVDSQEGLAVVSELGCEAAQGFYIARPMRADFVFDWVRSSSASTFGRELPGRSNATAGAAAD
jgi:diguanylate cyclase